MSPVIERKNIVAPHKEIVAYLAEFFGTLRKAVDYNNACLRIFGKVALVMYLFTVEAVKKAAAAVFGEKFFGFLHSLNEVFFTHGKNIIGCNQN